MMTRAQLIGDVQQRLGTRADAIKDARVLVAYSCNCRVEKLLSHPEHPVQRRQARRAQRLARKRGTGYPLAYLTGTRAFFGSSFQVSRHTLIPRPETEQLVEAALERAQTDTGYLDLGTGSGAIAVSLAQHTTLPVVATDRSRAALRVARNNARTHQVTHRVQFRRGNLLSAVHRHDLATCQRIVICANLPYLPDALYHEGLNTPWGDELQWEPKQALVSDAQDGLRLYEVLLAQLTTWRPHQSVSLIMELLPEQAPALTRLAETHLPTARLSVLPDLTGRTRFLICDREPTTQG